MLALTIFIPGYLGVTYHDPFTVIASTLPMFSHLSVPSACTLPKRHASFSRFTDSIISS